MEKHMRRQKKCERLKPAFLDARSEKMNVCSYIVALGCAHLGLCVLSLTKQKSRDLVPLQNTNAACT